MAGGQHSFKVTIRSEKVQKHFSVRMHFHDAALIVPHLPLIAETNALFAYHAVPLWDMELRLFKGFDNRVFTNLICPPDLPVLVNYPEETISIWVSGLAD